jgi:hypothetical protein
MSAVPNSVQNIIYIVLGSPIWRQGSQEKPGVSGWDPCPVQFKALSLQGSCYVHFSDDKTEAPRVSLAHSDVAKIGVGLKNWTPEAACLLPY